MIETQVTIKRIVPAHALLFAPVMPSYNKLVFQVNKKFVANEQDK